MRTNIMKYLFPVVMMVVCGENSYGWRWLCPWQRDSGGNDSSQQISYKKNNNLFFFSKNEEVGNPVTEKEVNKAVDEAQGRLIKGEFRTFGLSYYFLKKFLPPSIQEKLKKLKEKSQ